MLKQLLSLRYIQWRRNFSWREFLSVLYLVVLFLMMIVGMLFASSDLLADLLGKLPLAALAIALISMFALPDLDEEKRCRQLIETYHLDVLVLTCGTNGSYVFTKDTTLFQPTPKVEVADTVGAGDSFTGSFCAALLNGKSVEEAHKLAVQVSAFVCTQNGAMPVLPESLKQ